MYITNNKNHFLFSQPLASFTFIIYYSQYYDYLTIINLDKVRIVEIHRRINSLKNENLQNMEIDEIYLWYDGYLSIVTDGIKEDEEKSPKIFSKKSKLQKSTALKLLLKLQNYDIETLAFMYHFNIPFDNNLAKRNLRIIEMYFLNFLKIKNEN